MTLSLYQIVVPGISLFFILYAGSLFRRRKKSFKEFMIWIIFWGTVGFFAFYPSATIIFAQITGMKDNVNAVLFLSVGILFFIVFKLLLTVEKLEQKITKLVRKNALDNN